MNLRKTKKILVLIPTFLLAILLIQENYSWIFGIFIGTALALSSCELIQKAVSNSFVRKHGTVTGLFLIGFFFRFVLFAGLLYAGIVLFHVNAVAIAVSFTVVQLLYPFYLVHELEKREQHV
jgi:hypothetical protein